VAWGDDPSGRYAVLVPTAAGVILCHVRVNVSGEGPRASAKLVRWSRLQLGELAVETQGGHRIASFQVEGQVLRGADEQADAIAAFAIRLFAGVDGRPIPEPVEGRRPRARTAAARGTTQKADRKPAGAGKAASARSTNAAAPAGRTPTGRKPASGSASRRTPGA
jgi:hypothetical protein